MEDVVVSVENLTRHFGSKRALNQVNLQVPPGTVYGLVGENGAGKTTLIKHLLGRLRAQQGKAHVFGLDPVANPAGVLGRTGYLSEEPDLPGWMSIEELMKYMSAFYERWDHDYARELIGVFDLNPKSKIKNLSKGQRARTGLVAAQAHRPDLLLLDEPSSGLDPIVRRDILSAIIRNVVDDGRTVVFSSHLLDEIEQVSDVTTMISRGNVVLSGPTDEIIEQHSRIVVRTDRGEDLKFEGLIKSEALGSEWALTCRGSWPELKGRLEGLGLQIMSRRGLSLNDIFVAHAGIAPESEREVG